MRNVEHWQPTKFVRTRRGLAPSRDPGEVGFRSRMVASRQATAYEAALLAHASGVLLDVGCGKVPLYGVYRNRVDEAVCIDWANTAHPSPFLDYEVDLNRPIPLPDSRFDTVLATDVLEHLANSVLFWTEMARLLKPRGKIILGVPFLYWIHEAPHDHHRYTEYRLRAFCEENTLKVLSLEPYGGPAAVILDLIGKNLPGHGLSAAYQACSRWLLETVPGRMLDSRRARLFPLGYTLVAQKADGE